MSLIKTYLEEGIKSIDLSLSENQITQFEAYFNLLIEWNKEMNLTSITEPKEVVQKHFIDSLRLAHVCDMASITSLLDVGTGAGFPGIPLKIVFPHLEVTLLDALSKRINFLEQVIEELGLEHIVCIHGRAEDYGRDLAYREQYDIVTSRAVSQLNILSEYCIPFVKIDGKFIAYKAAKVYNEIEESLHAFDVLGVDSESIKELTFELDYGTRSFVIASKIATTPDKYPRRAGKVEKKPL
jgi:16S rRNA (guanine527-N7)-methyltransferase